MKRVFLLLIATIASFGVMAQNTEIRVGYGVASSNRLLNTEHGIFGVDWGQQIADIKSVSSSSGAITFGLRYKISRIRLGVSGAYEKVNGTFSDSANNAVDGNHTYWTVAADLQFSYLKLPKGIVELYWGASAGCAFVSQDINGLNVGEQTRRRFAYQVVPLGISVGIPWVGVYAEAGFGYRGVLNVGAYIRF